jgi:peptide/nickel transport system ATP-binding protein
VNNTIISVKNLSVNFKTEDTTTIAVQEISFSIEKGKTLAIVGESGSGKSVSALSILQLLPKNITEYRSGKIVFNTKENNSIDIISAPDEQIEKIRGNDIGIIFQEPMTSLNPLMKCGIQVAEVLMLHKKLSKEKALNETIRLFEEVKLPNPTTIINRYPHELSGGQKQRVMIAMAISCNPNLLIADEPTTALDVTVQKSILELLKELQIKYNMAILFITHDLNLVKSFADNVLVLFKSKMIEYNSSFEIFNHPKDIYTQSLIACRPSTTERVKYLKTVEEIISKEEKYTPETNCISIHSFNERMATLQKKVPIFEINQLKIWYPTKKNFFGKPTAFFKAVNDVQLTIHESETMGLVGESGCGKTTIGKAMVKLVDITQGEILYKGKNIHDFSKSELKDYRSQVQIIFQDPYSSLNPRITIGDAIIEPMHVHGIFKPNERKDKAAELLEKVGLLPAHFNRYPHEFSGGQRQRISIARCLAVQPSFIICDESVSALDVSVQAQVLNLLVSLREEFNLSYLFISHDLGVVKHICDHISVMQKGVIVEKNNAEELYAHPNNLYTQALINSHLH